MTAQAIRLKVSETTGVSLSDIEGRTKPAPVVEARQLAMYLSRRVLGMKLKAIGAAFQRDHATVINAIKQVERRRQSNPVFAIQVECLEAEINLDSNIKVF